MNKATITVEHQGARATVVYAYEDDLDSGLVRVEGDDAAQELIGQELRAAPSVMTPYGLRSTSSSWHFLRNALAPWTTTVEPPGPVEFPPVKPDRIY